MNNFHTLAVAIDEFLRTFAIQEKARLMFLLGAGASAASGIPTAAEMICRYAFLLWTQGDLPEVTGGKRHFYQEKRGIPAPLVVRRFRGQAPMEQIAEEILKLTKMNWNNHQVYNRRPVTLTFSDELSDIAKQVQQVWPSAYDFRYFM